MNNIEFPKPKTRVVDLDVGDFFYYKYSFSTVRELWVVVNKGNKYVMTWALPRSGNVCLMRRMMFDIDSTARVLAIRKNDGLSYRVGKRLCLLVANRLDMQHKVMKQLRGVITCLRKKTKTMDDFCGLFSLWAHYNEEGSWSKESVVFNNLLLLTTFNHCGWNDNTHNFSLVSEMQDFCDLRREEVVDRARLEKLATRALQYCADNTRLYNCLNGLCDYNKAAKKLREIAYINCTVDES